MEYTYKKEYTEKELERMRMNLIIADGAFYEHNYSVRMQDTLFWGIVIGAIFTFFGGVAGLIVAALGTGISEYYVSQERDKKIAQREMWRRILAAHGTKVKPPIPGVHYNTWC